MQMPWRRTISTGPGQEFRSFAFDRLSFAYGEGEAAVETVRDFSLEVRAGEFVTIVGPSGCGKSTLFNVASGLTPATPGAVLINDEPLKGVNPYSAYMFQRDALLDWRDVLGNVSLGREFLGASKKEAEAGLRDSLAEFGLDGFDARRPYELSGGMRQRVALMRTYATDRPLLLLDEPFGALDALTRLRMQEFLLRRWDDDHRTVIFITHDVDEALLLGDRVIVLTPRPARICEEIAVGLERPRSAEALMASPEYVALRARIMHLLHSPTAATAAVGAGEEVAA
jgi:ABC-type nitrate/sulfonate/bicarbonate transport system ATPase subunit